MKIEKNVRLNDKLRKAYNNLSEKTFGINFEEWYQAGYWGEKHIPYSIMDGDVMAANVSVNVIDMVWNGQKKKFIQLGTVETAESYRKKGYSRLIMEEIFKDYEEKCDGFFLFANDTVLDFYPKFGFQKMDEFHYYKNVNINGDSSIEKVDMKNESMRNSFVQAIKESRLFSKFDASANFELIMFYAGGFMSENVYYDKYSDTYVIAELENEEIVIYGCFSKENVSVDDVVEKFGGHINKITLGYVPVDVEEYHIEKIIEEDTTLFVRGFDFREEKLMFPLLAHS